MFALATHDDDAGVPARRRNRQGDEFGDTQAGGIKEFDQAGEPGGAHPLAQRRLQVAPCGETQQPVDLGEAESLRQRAGTLRAFEHGGGVVLALPLGVEEAVELADRREAAGHRRRPQSAPRERAEIAAHILGRRRLDGSAGAREVGGKVRKVAAIRRQRVGRGPAFRRQHVEKKRNQPAVGRLRRAVGGTRRCTRCRTSHRRRLSGS